MEYIYTFIEKAFVPAMLPIILIILEHYFRKRDTEKVNSDISNINSDISDVKDITSKIEEERINSTISSEENVVIVPATWTLDFIKEYNIYFCKKGRSFRDKTEYIGFYYQGAIKGYSKFEKIDFSKLKEETKNAYKNRFGDETLDEFYKLKDFKNISFPWRENGKSAIQNRQYISIEELVK